METQEVTRANILARNDKIRLVDDDDELGLELYCYNYCTNEDDDFVKQCRGVVFNGDKLVMKAFSYTYEYNNTECDLIEEWFMSNVPLYKWHFYPSYEGALLRLFYFSGKWFLSTHRKLNAFRSKWSSSESFGTLFKKALEYTEATNHMFAEFLGEGENILDRFQNKLDKDKQYMFLLRNTNDNRIVCLPPENNMPKLYHVGTFNKGELNLYDNIGLPYPPRINFLNVDEILDYVEKSNPMAIQGVVCFGPNNVQVKIVSKEYQELFRVRGNEPSVKFRYLQIRMDEKMTEMLCRLYPELSETFDDYEKTLYRIAENIYNAYHQRFVKKMYITVPTEEFFVVKQCHSWHLTNRVDNIVTLRRVINVLNQQSPVNLNRMIRRFKTEQSKKIVQPRQIRGSRHNSPAITSMPVKVNLSLNKLPRI